MNVAQQCAKFNNTLDHVMIKKSCRNDHEHFSIPTSWTRGSQPWRLTWWEGSGFDSCYDEDDDDGDDFNDDVDVCNDDD